MPQESQEALQLSDAHKAYDVPSPIVNQVDPSRRIPERQVDSSQEKFEWRIGRRSIKITSGFNEPTGHGKKGSMLYIDDKNPDPKNPATKSPGNYNVGIDYVYPPGENQNVTPLYSGKVVSAKNTGSGYGNQVVIETNQTYEYNGKRYPIYNTYSHLGNIEKNIRVGADVTTDTYLGEMGRSGLSEKYGKHVDLQNYIVVDGKKIQISPNLMQSNLEKQSKQGTFKYAHNTGESNNPIITVTNANDNLTLQSDQSKINPEVANTSRQQTELSSLYTQLYNLAVEASGGDPNKVLKYLSEYGENGLIAYKQNDPTIKELSETQQDLAVNSAIKNATAKENVLS
jgi:hypothetical protein